MDVDQHDADLGDLVATLTTGLDSQLAATAGDLPPLAAYRGQAAAQQVRPAPRTKTALGKHVPRQRNNWHKRQKGK